MGRRSDPFWDDDGPEFDKQIDLSTQESIEEYEAATENIRAYSDWLVSLLKAMRQ